MAHCPECSAEIDVDEDAEEGQRVECPDCNAALEILSTNPVELVTVSESDEEEEGSW
ncbi:MAG: lysine biosynthesis protein LysW [Acidobacteria bacterium]|nr:MAG: lysine biosynthesis protein LysW [Acidobacteriota bacterium]